MRRPGGRSPARWRVVCRRRRLRLLLLLALAYDLLHRYAHRLRHLLRSLYCHIIESDLEDWALDEPLRLREARSASHS